MSETPRRSSQSVNFLALAVCPILFWMLRGDIGSLLAGLILLGLFGWAGHILVTALEDEEAEFYRPHQVPRKLLGSVMMGIGVFLLATFQTVEVVTSVGLGFLALALSSVAFGIERDRLLSGSNRRKAGKETRKVIDTAERVLSAIPIRVSEVEDEPVFLHAQAFRNNMIRAIEGHPDLMVHLTGELTEILKESAEATDVFVEDFLEDPDPRIKRRYMVLLTELAQAFELCIDELKIPSDATAKEDDMFAELDRKQAA